MTDDLRPWGYAPGGYVFTCGDCPENQKIIDRPVGDKRSWRCEAHARAARDAEPTSKPAADDLIARLRAMYSHRGDGIPTQYVNPNGPEAADALEAMGKVLRPRPFDTWMEDYSDVLWHLMPIHEAPFCGTPHDSTWPYHEDDEPRLWWTPLPDCNEINRRWEALRTAFPEPRHD